MTYIDKNIAGSRLSSLYTEHDDLSCIYSLIDFCGEFNNDISIFLDNDLKNFKNIQLNFNNNYSVLMFSLNNDISSYMNDKLLYNLSCVGFKLNNYDFLNRFNLIIKKVFEAINFLELNTKYKINFNTYLTHITEINNKKSEFIIKFDIIIDNSAYIIEYEYSINKFCYYTYQNKELIIGHKNFNQITDNFIFCFHLKKELYNYISIDDISEDDVMLNKSEYLALLEIYKIS